jgi:hypothetical protein
MEEGKNRATCKFFQAGRPNGYNYTAYYYTHYIFAFILPELVDGGRSTKKKK